MCSYKFAGGEKCNTDIQIKLVIMYAAPMLFPTCVTFFCGM